MTFFSVTHVKAFHPSRYSDSYLIIGLLGQNVLRKRRNFLYFIAVYVLTANPFSDIDTYEAGVFDLFILKIALILFLKNISCLISSLLAAALVVIS